MRILFCWENCTNHDDQFTTKKKTKLTRVAIELRLGTNKNIHRMEKSLSYSRFSLIRFPLLIHTGTVVFNAISLNTMKVSLHWRFTDWQNIVCGIHFWLALRIPFMYIHLYMPCSHSYVCNQKQKQNQSREHSRHTFVCSRCLCFYRYQMW